MIRPMLVDVGEVVFGDPCETYGHVELQRGGKPVCVCEPWIVRAVFRRPDGVDVARHAEGEQIEKDLLILLKVPLPKSVSCAGDPVAPVFPG